MTGQYGLTENQQKQILKILDEANIQVDPIWREEREDGKMIPFHRNIKIQVSSYEDESEEFSMYVEVD